MAYYVINGGKPLTGEITIPGNKNAILPAMAAALLTDREVILTNVPVIRDVSTMAKIIIGLGASVKGVSTDKLIISAKNLKNNQPDPKLVADLRASVLLIGPILTRFGRVTLRHPGGDLIGRRSIGQHLDALEQMGARVQQDGLKVEITANKLIGTRVYLKESSVTATENTMMAASRAEGTTAIINAALEPHVYCLGEMLREMGVEISGHGTNTIMIAGQDKLIGCEHWVRPDHIEAGTWAIAAAATRGKILIHGVMGEDIWQIKKVFGEMGVVFELINCDKHHDQPGEVCLAAYGKDLKSTPKIQTGVWPAFPTDLMSPAIVLATQCAGMTLAHDWMYEGRMFFVDRLIKMGANIIMADPHRVIISGPTKLYGRQTSSPDIRAGVALVIASLIAVGKSEIHMAELIDRGYEHLDKRLRALGADITRKDD